MSIAVDWVFLCEHVEIGPDHEIVSMIRIVRPAYGFGVRALPLTLKPFFAVALRGMPRERVTLTVAVAADDGAPPALRHHEYQFGASADVECAVPVGTITFVEAGVYEFGLRVNGDTVLTIKAPLERAI